MRYFRISGYDKAGVLETRKATRDKHRAYINAQDKPAKLLFGSPMIGEDGEMMGTFLIVVAEERAQAEAFLAGDPYLAADIFERTEIIELAQSFDWTPLIPGIQPKKPA